ncbi:MAG: PAS domain-containing protein, partial [Syntrophothermus sp.]
MPEGIFTVDKNFRIIFFNKEAEAITGLKRESVLGKFCKYVFRSDTCLENCPIAQVLKTEKNIFDYESIITPCPGGNKTIKLNAAVLYNENNEPNGGVVTFRAISEFEAITMDLQKNTQFSGMIGHSKQMK